MKRPKKFIGAAIGAAVSIGGGIASSISQRRAQRKQMKAQNRNATLQQAANMTEEYNNTEYIDEFNNKVSFKAGGSIYTDRIKKMKRFKCGGKRK
jgi:hypothetical protein